MRLRRIAGVLLSLSMTSVASAHRLDEYLQATLISLEKDHIDISMRLIPGVAVSSAVIANIDSDGDGMLSVAERQKYAEQVLSGLSLTTDGIRFKPRLVSSSFPSVEEMREGLGEIHIDYSADLPRGGPNRSLVLENHTQLKQAVYLVNALAPKDPAISIVAQRRNQMQSAYQLDYTQSGVYADSPFARWRTRAFDEISSLGIPALFHLGMRHIAEGIDHLLFLLALLLPAPLVAVGSRWRGTTSIRESLLNILRIVTAFTLGHSITLALAAFGFIHIPSHPVEVLIAVSILVSAIHALRPFFPGKEASIAAFFGLIHGLAFASTLSQLGLGRWERLGGILAFNLGIETMQIAVVAAILPSLILMSRTRSYPWMRMGGALFAGIASVGWIVERVLDTQGSVDSVVNAVAHHSAWITGGLFVLSVACWAFQNSWSERAEPSKNSAGNAFRPPSVYTDMLSVTVDWRESEFRRGD